MVAVQYWLNEESTPMPATRTTVRRKTPLTKPAKSRAVLKWTYSQAVRKLAKQYSDAMKQSQRVGRPVSFRVEVDPFAAEPILSPLQEASDTVPFPVEEGSGPSPELQAALVAARDRGRLRVAEVLAADDMLSADAFADLLGTTRTTVNAKRQNGQLIGLDGTKRGYRFPTWQLDGDGRPYAALPKLFERLGKNPWAVYRLLMSPHNELNGRTGLDALRRGEAAAVLDVAESVSRGDFR
jgi:hypothetical protein